MPAEGSAKPVLSIIRQHVDSIYRSLKLASTGDAFAHWYLMTRFRMTELEASDACATSGPNDKGIDAVSFDDDTRQVYCFQFKYQEDGRASFGYDDSTKLRSTVEFLLDKSLLDNVVSQTLREALASIHDRREAGYAIVFYVVVLGTITLEAKKEIDAILKARPDVSIVVQDSTTIAELLPSPRVLPEINVDLPIYKGEWMEHQDPRYTSLITSIRAKDLADLRRKHGDKLFARNVRYFLGYRGANRGLLETLRNKQEREHFWFFHNGVTAVCDKYDIDEKRLRVSIKNFQIVNGCQTTVTLDEGLSYFSSDDPGPTLVLRVIRTKEDEDFLRKISKYTNTQSQVTQQDLASNDKIQLYIQEEFARIGYFYERQRGEWDSRTLEERSPYVSPDGMEKRIANGDVAKAIMAFIGNPTEAKTKKQMHFVHSSIGGYYDVIFDPARNVWEYLLAYDILTYCEERRKQFQVSFRELEQNEFKGMTEEQIGELNAKQFILHSETHMAALIGEFTKEKVAPTHFPKLVNLLGSGDYVPLDYVYGITEEILTQHFLEKMKSRDFQPARFFKSPRAWPEVRETVRGQIRVLARIAKQDPVGAFGQMLNERGVPA